MKNIINILLASLFCFILFNCVTATSRLENAKENMTGKFDWHIDDVSNEALIMENSNAISDAKLVSIPKVNIVEYGEDDNLGYKTTLRLEKDNTLVILVFVGEKDNCFSFYKGGANHVGVFAEVHLNVNGKKGIYVSSKQIDINSIESVPYSIIEVVKEFSHVYHSYIGGVRFNKDWTIILNDFYEEEGPVKLTIIKDSMFTLGD